MQGFSVLASRPQQRPRDASDFRRLTTQAPKRSSEQVAQERLAGLAAPARHHRERRSAVNALTPTERRMPMSYNCKTPNDVIKVIKNDKIEMIDLRFTDLPGLWQHFSVPPRALDANSFSDGVGFDGSSIRGFQEIQESDMLVVPDPTTAFVDVFAEAPTLVLICSILDPITGQPYNRDPRYIAQKAEAYLRSTGTGDAAYFGPELEHFVFNEVHYDQGTNYGYYEIDAMEANWKARGGTGLGHKLRPKEGYFPVPPADALQDARSSMVIALERIGIAIEATTTKSQPAARA